MPITHEVDSLRERVRVTLQGRVGAVESCAFLEALVTELAPHGPPLGLIDTLGLEALELGPTDVRQLAAIAERHEGVFTGSRWAVIAADDLVFGMARVYATLRSEASYAMRVFRGAAEADAWLSAPRETADADPRP